MGARAVRWGKAVDMMKNQHQFGHQKGRNVTGSQYGRLDVLLEASGTTKGVNQTTSFWSNEYRVFHIAPISKIDQCGKLRCGWCTAGAICTVWGLGSLFDAGWRVHMWEIHIEVI